MWAILWKDLLLELRTKERVSSLFVLALLIILIFVFALTPEQLQQPAFGSALLWVTLVFAGMLSIQRALILEQERNCFAGLLLCPIDPGQVFFAKFLGNVFFLTVVEAWWHPSQLRCWACPFRSLCLPSLSFCSSVLWAFPRWGRCVPRLPSGRGREKLFCRSCSCPSWFHSSLRR